MSTPSRFIIVKHNAKKAGLHYDLRFKMPDSRMYDSYAVPKGVPKESGIRVRAIKTTLHTEKEAMFIGRIQNGNYGAGTIERMDKGPCSILKYEPHHIVILLNGSIYKGVYHLVLTGEDDKNYLLFKQSRN